MEWRAGKGALPLSFRLFLHYIPSNSLEEGGTAELGSALRPRRLQRAR